MKRSAIEWTDYSGGNLNFVRRGSKVGDCEISDGCQSCYVLRLNQRFNFLPEKATIYPDKLAKLRTQKFPPVDGRRPRVFVCDTGDLFHESVPADFIIWAFEVMGDRDDVIWQVLTKRPERMASVLFGQEGNWYLGGNDYMPNIWIGVTTENQEMADARIPVLLDAWAGTKFVSVEPYLSAVDLRQWFSGYETQKIGDETKRDSDGGLFHRRSGPGLASQVLGRQQERIAIPTEDTHCADKGGAFRFSETSQDHVLPQRAEACDICAPSCLDCGESAVDTGRARDKPQERGPNGQPPGQSRSGHSTADQ